MIMQQFKSNWGGLQNFLEISFHDQAGLGKIRSNNKFSLALLVWEVGDLFPRVSSLIRYFSTRKSTWERNMKYGAGINWDVNSILPQFWSGPPTTPFSFCTWATNNYLSAPTICQCKGQRNSYCALVKKEELLLYSLHFFETKRYLSGISLVVSESERIKPAKC